MNEAIKLAIEEGGYMWGGTQINTIGYAERHVIICDPAFWQALSKALVWNRSERIVPYGEEEFVSIPTWLFYAHLYFDLVLTGGDTEKFWKELLPYVNEG